jgi:glycosyltransferase involved in cell wall biosynthesis
MSSPFSVIIPSYNGRSFIGEALQSIYLQSQPPLEVIVVDDGSTDGTPDLIASHERTSPIALRLLALERNSGGPAHPINKGVEIARGDYIVVLDQDDVLTQNSLEKKSHLLNELTELALVGSCCADLSNPEARLQSSEILADIRSISNWLGGAHLIDGHSFLRLLMRHLNFLLGFPAFAFRKADWEAKGGLDTSFTIATDYDFLCWLCSRGKVAFLPEILFHHRYHTQNLCRQRARMFVEICRVQAKSFRFHANLRQDQQCAVAGRSLLLYSGYLAREEGEFANSLWCYRTALRFWGLDYRTLHGLIRLPVGWLETMTGICVRSFLPFRSRSLSHPS